MLLKFYFVLFTVGYVCDSFCIYKQLVNVLNFNFSLLLFKFYYHLKYSCNEQEHSFTFIFNSSLVTFCTKLSVSLIYFRGCEARSVFRERVNFSGSFYWPPPWITSILFLGPLLGISDLPRIFLLKLTVGIMLSFLVCFGEHGPP